MTVVSVEAAMIVLPCHSEPVLTLAWESVLLSLLPREKPFVCNSNQLYKFEFKDQKQSGQANCACPLNV